MTLTEDRPDFVLVGDLGQDFTYDWLVLGARSYRLDGDRLELRSDKGKPTLVFRKKTE